MSDCQLEENGEKDETVAFPVQPPTLSLQQPKKRKLVLHLDLNNTILVSDAATGQGPRAALNSYLSTVTWGQISETGEWMWLSDSVSVTAPCNNAVNYYTQFGRNAQFTDTKMGKRFKEIFDRHMRMLEWQGQANNMFTQKEGDGTVYHWILPSFFHLLENLHQQGREFSVLLRTFGVDLPLILPALHSALLGEHPHFPQLRKVPLNVGLTPGKIRCSTREVVMSWGSDRISTKADKESIYKYFNSVTGIGGIQDHFDWWARNHFSGDGGKPFWIDPSDRDTQHIFIDDNIRLNEEDTIVNCQVFMNQQHKPQPRKVTTSELYGICLVQNDLLRAIAEKDYFLDCIRVCEENYDRYLSNFPLQEAQK
ncbi:hypothetical protein XENTR_v10012827 [Xenopus tropicalis]|nr:uncharacterized protein LOC100488455 isoform X1 [Xenopus tropicalis]XP_031757043.1 uncharacterized protein LOC100488455 isoform X1 [Xenopus tropicalis]KAE8612356.1 hypothetical protein XENTR_v10012827 [Xenopus tropicalis]|eukprot:XP_002933119.2 PREDICTED: uncharacterized protein LOC100488455 isoform X1 [Xenopus tropicalis]